MLKINQQFQSISKSKLLKEEENDCCIGETHLSLAHSLKSDHQRMKTG